MDAPISSGSRRGSSFVAPAGVTELEALASALADRYALDRELGRGGMATVFLAEERKHGRQVAIKVLRPEVGNSLGGERFLREINIAARLAHPHIVPLIDSGDANGLLYYVSPYVPGGSLRDRLRESRTLTVEEALRIAQEIGSGLDYAHRSGVVHRDVKPENILFADAHALLADFGVARALGAAGTNDRVTEAGMALGTPEYMSPEQASGEENLGAASDVYSLACVMFEMLAGEPPFCGGSARVTMVRHLTETPRSVRTLRPDAPPSVEAALARALAKDPASRFPSAAAFVSELGATRGGRSRGRTSVGRSIAVLPFVNASPDPQNEYLSDGITDELIDALAKVEGLRVASRTSVFALKGKPQDVRAIGALLGASVVLEGTVRKSATQLRITAQLTSTDDGRLLWSQRYDREVSDVFTIQDEIARTIVSTLRATSFADLDLEDITTPIRRRATDNVVAYGLYLRGRYEWNKRTQESILEAISFFEQAIAEDPNYALAYTGLADSYALQVDYRSVPVVEGFERARDYARKAIALDDTLAEAHTSLAWILFIHGWEWEESGREFRRAIELDPQYATAHQWYAFHLAAQGRQEESIIESHMAQELDPASVSVRRSVAWIYMYARRYDQMRHHIGRAIAMNPTAEENYRILGMALALEGDFEEAERILRYALTMPGTGTYTTATLGYALALAGRTDAAREQLAQLTAQARTGYVSPVSFATLYLGLGDVESALDWAERAYDDRRGWLAYVRVNPLMDPLRGHPRFEALVRRMGL